MNMNSVLRDFYGFVWKMSLDPSWATKEISGHQNALQHGKEDRHGFYSAISKMLRELRSKSHWKLRNAFLTKEKEHIAKIQSILTK